MTETSEPTELRPLSRQARRSTAEPNKALAILGAWQAASFRGYLAVEKRNDRRLVVLTLIAALIAEAIPFRGLVLAADEIARDQWRQLLVRDGHALEGWTVRTPVEVLVDGGVVDAGCVVVADELDSYLTDDLAAALTGSRAVLGLCSSPRALGEAQSLRRYIGRTLKLEGPIPQLDFQSLLENPPDELMSDKTEPTEPREQVTSATRLDNLLGIYLSEIQKIPLLKAEEEIGLAKRIEAGLYATKRLAELAVIGQKIPLQQRRDMQWICRDGERAKNTFIKCNLRLVYQIARKYSQRMEIMDLIQEGNLGLIRAVEKFDYKKGFKFSTYSTWWIRQSITRAIADKSNLIRIPVHLVESDNSVLSVQRRRLLLGESTRARDIAAELSLSAQDVEAAINRHRLPYSLELMAEAGFDLLDEDDLTALDWTNFGLLVDQIHSVLTTLSEREAGVIRLRYGLVDGVARTLDEIGQVYGVTRERIRQIESDSMEKLRHPSRSQVLRVYLD